MKYEDIPRTRRYLHLLDRGLNDIEESIKDTRAISAELPQFDSVLAEMQTTTEDLQTKVTALDKELETLYVSFVDGFVEK